MNFYSFHIGDYAAHTKHLCIIEDLAYRRMLDLYYTSEQPLPLDVDRIARLIGMRDHMQNVSDVLSDFFLKSENGYINKRCDEEIATYKAKAERAKQANRTRWEAQKSETDLISDVISDAFRVPTNNQEPITNKETKTKEIKEKSDAQPSGFAEFWDSYPAHPRKGGKAKCLKIWLSRKLENKAQQILTHLAWQKKDWAKSNNEYVQMPQSYLNAAKWDGWIDMGEQKRERGFVS